MHKALRRGLSGVAVLGLVAAMAAPLHAQVNDAYNTGEFVDTGRDMFWYFVNGQFATPSGGEQAYVVGDPYWIDPPADSRWVSIASTGGSDAPDNFWTTYYTTFSVTDPGAFFLTGLWSSDNDAHMFLNGTAAGSIPFTAFRNLYDFKLTDGFVYGENTLAVQVWNGAASTNPTGLLVADVEGTVTPEPISLLLLAPGLLGVGLVARRRRNGDAA